MCDCNELLTAYTNPRYIVLYESSTVHMPSHSPFVVVPSMSFMGISRFLLSVCIERVRDLMGFSYEALTRIDCCVLWAGSWGLIITYVICGPSLLVLMPHSVLPWGSGSDVGVMVWLLLISWEIVGTIDTVLFVGVFIFIYKIIKKISTNKRNMIKRSWIRFNFFLDIS